MLIGSKLFYFVFFNLFSDFNIARVITLKSRPPFFLQDAVSCLILLGTHGFRKDTLTFHLKYQVIKQEYF